MNKLIFTESRAIFHLAVPLMMNLVAYMGMTLIDVAMLGRLGPIALAASAAGNVMYVIVLAGGVGVLSAIGTLAAEAFGDKNQQRITLIVRQGFFLALLLAIPAILWVLVTPRILLFIKQPYEVVLGAKDYLHGLIYGYLPCMLFCVLREFMTALHKPRVIMMITISALPFNALLNYVFIYGKLGFPALGIYGVGLATSIVEWLMLFTMVLYVFKKPSLRIYQIFQIKWPHEEMRRILRLGCPVGVSFVVEELLFVITTLLMGYFGVVALAAHQIALQCIYVAAMVQIGMSQATSVRVSRFLGANDRIQARQTAYVAIVLGACLAVLVACFFWFAPHLIIRLFINPARNIVVATLAVKLLSIVALFHIIDAIQIVTGGALRGYQDTLVPMFLGIISYWIIGIGAGVLFGFVFHFGPQGLWWGLSLGLCVSAILLQWRLRTQNR